MSGFKRHKGERLRFLTLTTSKKLDLFQLNYFFVLLTSRVRHLTPIKLMSKGYISERDFRYYYNGKNDYLRFDYFKVKVTDEGVSGVIHTLFFGDYLPQSWISDTWLSLSDASIVDIRATKKKVGNPKRLANYVISQYVINQDGGKRFSWSKNWVFYGFVGVWKFFIKEFGLLVAIDKWDFMLGGNTIYNKFDRKMYYVDATYHSSMLCQSTIDGVLENMVIKKSPFYERLLNNCTWL